MSSGENSGGIEMRRLTIAPLSILLLAVGVYAAILNFTFTVTSASVTTSGTSVSVSGNASLTVSGVAPDTGTFSASGSLANINGGNVTVPFTTTLGHGTLTGNMTFPETVLVGSGGVSGSATITGGTGRYASYGSGTVTASGLTGAVLSGGMLSFSVSGTASGVNFTFTVTNAPVTISGTSVFSGPATLTLAGSSPDTGTFSASGSLLTNISGGNLTVPFTVTLGHGTITGTMTFPETVLVSSGPVSGSATITSGTGSYAGYTSSTLTASGTVTGSVLSGGTLSFSVSGTVNATAVPTILSVTDGASYTSNISEGAFFTVWGSNLAPSNLGLTNFPRPLTVGGVTVTVTPAAGGTGTPVYLIYVGTGQINCVLPSTVAPGNYNVTVTSGGTTSSPVATQVAASKPALFTQDQSGTGLAVVYNYISQSESDVNRLTTGNYDGSLSSPAKPGQVLIAWGTGLGPYAAGDNATGVVYDFSKAPGTTILAIVGGVSIPVAFAGLSGYAADDQINFTLPSNIATGCAVSLQISVNGVLSAPTSIAIAPSPSATVCVQPGYTTAQLQSLDQGGTITTGGFSLTQIAATVPPYGAVKEDSASGAFAQVSGFQLAAASTSTVNIVTSGSCEVIHATSTGTATAIGHVTDLDAGTVTLTGPAGTNLNKQALTEISNTYSLVIGTEGITIPGQLNGSILPGTYTLTGAGGNDVGPFSTSITIGSPLNVNPALPTTVTESAGLTISWTGGLATDIVEILGGSGTIIGTGANQVTNSTAFICSTTAGQGTFTVPASILTQLPTITAAQVTAGTATGYLDVTSGTAPVNFNATLKKDGSNIPSIFVNTFGIGVAAVYQ
jgi:uncharacterized protein (TIGR03437 family)